MDNIRERIKAFHRAVLQGENLFREGKITFEDYAGLMLCYEQELKIAGVSL